MPPLEQMAGPTSAGVQGLSILGGHPAHQIPQWDISYLDGHMDVVRHPAVGVYATVVALDAASD